MTDWSLVATLGTLAALLLKTLQESRKSAAEKDAIEEEMRRGGYQVSAQVTSASHSALLELLKFMRGESELLQKQIIELRAENRVLHKEIEDLKADNRRLHEEIARLTPPPESCPS